MVFGTGLYCFVADFFLRIDNFIHKVDLFSDNLVFLLQKLMTGGFILFKYVRNGLAILIDASDYTVNVERILLI